MQEKVTTKMALMFPLGFPGGSDGNKSTCNAGDPGLIPGLGPTSVFLSGEFNGERSLEGYSLWGYKVLDMTEQLTFTFLKLMYRFSVISIKIPAAFLKNGQADYKSHM